MFLHYFKKRIFWKIGLLFVASTLALVLLQRFLIDWSFSGSDNILDAHDAYYHYKLVDSWGENPDTAMLSQELDNLHIKSTIFLADNDVYCDNDTLIFWTNIDSDVSLCDYLSYSDSRALGERHDIQFPAYVSFGDLYINNELYQATLVEHQNKNYLLVVDYVFPNQNFNIFPLIVLTVIFVWFLYYVIRRFLYPINLIKKRIAALESGDLTSKIKVLGEDELADLSANFNQLIEDIKKLLNQKERLLSEVSHELRSPLAKIRLMLAMIPHHKKIDEIDKQIKSLDSIITNILLSDKMSSPYSNLTLENIKVDSLIRQALELTFVKNININIKNSFSLKVDIVKCAIAMKNLIENAFKYDDSKQPINIVAYTNKDFYNIAVIDSGPGIPDELMGKITKAFVRGPHKNTSGFGLGLSISHKVVSAHNGHLKIQNNIGGGGATFTLQLPKQ